MSKCGAHRGISVKVWCTQRDGISVKVWCTQRDKRGVWCATLISATVAHLLHSFRRIPYIHTCIYMQGFIQEFWPGGIIVDSMYFSTCIVCFPSLWFCC